MQTRTVQTGLVGIRPNMIFKCLARMQMYLLKHYDNMTPIQVVDSNMWRETLSLIKQRT